MTTILAFDSALWRTGVALLRDGELVRTIAIANRHRRRVEQLGYIYDCTRTLLHGWEQPDIVAIESSVSWQRGGHDRAATVAALAQSRAAIILAVHVQRLAWRVQPRIVEVDVHHVRELVCGLRTANKLQVTENLKLRGYTLPTDTSGAIDMDCCDALALAVCVYLEERLKNLAREQGHVV